jgi:hypothetical protein
MDRAFYGLLYSYLVTEPIEVVSYAYVFFGADSAIIAYCGTKRNDASRRSNRFRLYDG